MRRVALVCPGRGSYTRTELGTLTDASRPDPGGVRAGLVARADRHRELEGRARVSDLDRRARFGAEHLAGENAAALICTGTAADAASLREDLDVVAVCGNSMGWYSALHVAGALGFDDGLRLADTLGASQKDGVIGGQVIVPVVDQDWRRDPLAEEAVRDALALVLARGFHVWHSIRLGGFEVLAGDNEAIRLLLEALPRSRVGERDYPFQLLGHSAFHTPLMGATSAKVRVALRDLPWAAPRRPLVDGRGRAFSPWSARPEDLFDYTLLTQVVDTFDFGASVRVVLREFAPDALVLLGPGDSLGGAIGQILVQEGWAGIRSKRDFVARQKSSEPVLVSMARPEQAALVARSPEQDPSRARAGT